MPELPEVETVCRLMRRVLKGKRIVEARVPEDEIVLSGVSPSAFIDRLVGSKVVEVGRKGKYWWLELEEKPWLMGHLGMSGWIRDLKADSIRLLSHGNAALDTESGEPKFLKLLLRVEGGATVVFTDGRRLGRLWLSDGPHQDSRIQRLGFDVLTELPPAERLFELLRKRKVSIKGVLLDQGVFAGIGNWIADEVLFQSRIAPSRIAATLDLTEVSRLHQSIKEVVELSVRVGADHLQYPDSWLFCHRWGGNRGSASIQGHSIVREQIAGRTTAWVPELQN